MADKLLGQDHQVLIGGVGLVELQHGEFGIVLDGEPFVPEIAVDLEDPVEAADHQALQIEFRGDPQVQGHVQGLVVGDEGPGRGAPGNGLHHGGLHLQEAPGLKKLPHQTDDRGPPDKNFPHLGVDHQVQVALAVAGLHVREAVVLFRQGQEALGEEHEVGHRQGELPGLGAEQRAGKPHDVAQVQALEPGEGLRAEHLFLDVGLDAAGAVLEVAEGGLAELPEQHQAAGQTEGPVQPLQLGPGQGPELLPKPGRWCGWGQNRWQRARRPAPAALSASAGAGCGWYRIVPWSVSLNSRVLLNRSVNLHFLDYSRPLVKP